MTYMNPWLAPSLQTNFGNYSFSERSEKVVAYVLASLIEGEEKALHTVLLLQEMHPTIKNRLKPTVEGEHGYKMRCVGGNCAIYKGIGWVRSVKIKQTKMYR